MTESNRTWPSMEPTAAFDVNTPAVARVYDALLGGKNNFVADRQAADIYLKHVPKAAEIAAAHREALSRGVEYMARTGIDQFLDIGCGLPTEENTHDAAHRVNPDATVVYVDNDPVVTVHGHALLTTENTAVVTGDLRRPQAIVDCGEIAAVLDFHRPIGLMVAGLHMHFHDDERPDEWVRVLLSAMPSGSRLFITDCVDTGEELQRSVELAGLESLGSGWIRSPERIREHFIGLPLVDPGLDFIDRWFPGEPDREIPASEDLADHQRIMMAGIGVKP